MSKKFKFSIPIVIVGVLVVALLWVTLRQTLSYQSSLVGQQIPDFSVTTFARSPYQLQVFDSDTIKGKVAVINFFASWCSMCRIEHPVLKHMAVKKGIKIYGIALRDRSDMLEAFLTQQGDPFEVIGMDKTGSMASQWGIVGVPETFVVDNQGIIRFHHRGALSFEMVENELIPILDKYS